MNNKRALVCSSYPPDFDRDSGSRRLFDLIELLCADGWKLSLLAASRMGDPRYTRQLQRRGVAVLDGSKVRAEGLIRAAQFDLALFSGWTVAEAYLALVRRVAPVTRVIIDSVDLNFLRNARRFFRASVSLSSLGRLD